ncbi:hypothetical protein AB434_2294 [Heyndrickxia coagulans]|uniref:Uncharacterized protein n=1 Tax=Heyndrickxia coagulans TaxID=1398 RepID=A0AAN0T9S3_HEYCO|nr:hypothetical protein SB48_HM08orf04822 [Heyndrickxia coagulans]AKN54699.1 hypothetical protein AB434_2294 [Heyndrickxia coagulans]
MAYEKMIRPDGSGESAPTAVAWTGRMGRASGLDGKDFSGGGKRQYFTWKRGIPRQKKQEAYFFGKKLDS